MRIDHFTYQRATKVAGVGLLLQAVIGVGLLIFGLLSTSGNAQQGFTRDHSLIFASLYVLPGVLVWLGLVIIFHQHKLERLESLEEDELAATRGASGPRSSGMGGGQQQSVFDQAREESLVAARRLGLMHKWFMPALSLVMVAVLALLCWLMLKHMKATTISNTADFTVTDQRGWSVAVCLILAAVSFIFSRFVAGMARQTAWANLRGGAAYMVGNALVLVAVAAGVIFRFFDNEKAIQAVAWGIPILMGILAVEITLNFILNLYRPRVPGDVPRPAFDSKLLSLFSAPDNIVRSMNEAVNYQFGFDITSSWGYQLLLRSVAWLFAIGFVSLILLSTMVVVEPHQQAIRLRGGAMVGNTVHRSGIMWKLPWPIESSAVYDVSRLRSLWLTARVTEQRNVNLWTGDAPKTDVESVPFIVTTPVSLRTFARLPGETATTMPAGGAAPVVEGDETQTPEDAATAAVSAVFSLIDAEIVLQYRIRSDGGLVDYLRFATDDIARLQTLTNRERALRTLALSVVSRELSRRSIDEVLSPGRSDLTQDLAAKVQAEFDARKTGVEVVAIEIPNLRPTGIAAEKFEEYAIGIQGKQEFIGKAERNLSSTFTYWIGDQSLEGKVMEGINQYEALRAANSPDAETKRREVLQMLVRGEGQAAQIIALAERDRWVDLMRRRTQMSNVQGQLASYRAAPELFQQREIMRVYAQLLPNIDKYVLGVDPSRVNIDIDLKKVDPILDFAGASEEETNK